MATLTGLLPLLLLTGGGLGRGMIKKVILYGMFGMLGLLIGGGASLRDMLLIPMVAPAFSGMLGGGSSGGSVSAAQLA